MVALLVYNMILICHLLQNISCLCHMFSGVASTSSHSCVLMPYFTAVYYAVRYWNLFCIF